MVRDLRLFYLFRLLATSYLWLPLSIPFMMSRGLSFEQITWLGAIYCVVVIAIEIPTGALADRMGRRGSMMAGALALVASSLVSANAGSFASFAVAEALAAVSMSLCSGADSAYLFDLLARRGRAHEYAHCESVASGWHLAGAAGACALGGMLGERDLVLAYHATTAVGALAFVAAFLLRPETAVRPVSSRGVELRAYLRTMRDAVRDVARSRRLLWVMAYSALVFILIRATSYIYQPYLDSRGFGLAEIGFVFAGVHVFAAAVAMHGERLRRRFGERVLVWSMLAGLAMSFVLLTGLTGRWAASGLAVQSIAFGLYSPLVKPMLNREIADSSRRATVLSIESIAKRAAMAIYSPLVGAVTAISAIGLCAVTGFLGLAVLALARRHSPARTERLGSLGADPAAGASPSAVRASAHEHK